MASVPAEGKYGYEDSRFEKEVDANFHCSICYNVLKEPMMCRHNEHIFCRACITEHLTVNSHTCPECNDGLTVETLRRAPRLAINYLSELKINCDYSSRGCQEFVRLEELDAHVEKCDFAPVKCSNEGCEMIINKREVIHHETAVCEYRKVKCHNCVEIEQDVKEMKAKMEEIAGMKEDIAQVKVLMVQLFEKLRYPGNAMQMSAAINHASDAEMGDILIAGGYDNRAGDNVLKSAERFSWKKNVWERVCPMNLARMGATSIVYENQLFVAGGCDSNAVEVLNLNEDLLQSRLYWGKLETTLPYLCVCLRSVVYQNRAILFCGCGKMDDCAELSLIPRYPCKLLCVLPEPRKSYAVVAFKHKVLIFGGRSATTNDLLDSVSQFDINTNEFKPMPPLPYATVDMAGIRWGEQAVLIGGFDRNRQSKKVIMYDSKTGNTTVLPPMLEERSGCCAVVTGNTIVVMGGRGKGSNGRVRSVEVFTLGGYSWKYLPNMNDIRSLATATVLPTKSNFTRRFEHF